VSTDAAISIIASALVCTDAAISIIASNKTGKKNLIHKVPLQRIRFEGSYLAAAVCCDGRKAPGVWLNTTVPHGALARVRPKSNR